jgi:hypothetical protein
MTIKMLKEKQMPIDPIERAAVELWTEGVLLDRYEELIWASCDENADEAVLAIAALMGPHWRIWS